MRAKKWMVICGVVTGVVAASVIYLLRPDVLASRESDGLIANLDVIYMRGPLSFGRITGLEPCGLRLRVVDKGGRVVLLRQIEAPHMYDLRAAIRIERFEFAHKRIVVDKMEYTKHFECWIKDA